MTMDIPWGAQAVSLPTGTELEPHESEWIDKINTLGITADIDLCLDLLDSCPLSLTRRKLCGVFAGVLLGRVLAMSCEERAGRKEQLKRLYALSSFWTITDPEAFCLFVETVGPEVLYVAIRLWPEGHQDSRLFCGAVLWGLHLEHAKGTEFLKGSGALESLRTIVTQAIYPGDGPGDEPREDQGEEQDERAEGKVQENTACALLA